MHRSVKQLRDRAEELRTKAEDLKAEECRRISMELAEVCDILADQTEAMIIVKHAHRIG